MEELTIRFLLMAPLLFSLPAQPPYAARVSPVWNRHATTVINECGPSQTHCKLMALSSPNHSHEMHIDADSNRLLSDDDSNLAVSVGDNPTQRLTWQSDWVNIEAMWSPDSTGFSITGDPNAYTNGTRLYVIKPSGLALVSTKAIETDMVAHYPPCVGVTPFDAACEAGKDGSAYNYATVAWAAPHTAVIMAEVVPSSSWGSNMGQVRGYEFDVLSEKITRTMTAQQLKARWQPQLAWQLRIPEPPPEK